MLTLHYYWGYHGYWGMNPADKFRWRQHRLRRLPRLARAPSKNLGSTKQFAIQFFLKLPDRKVRCSWSVKFPLSRAVFVLYICLGFEMGSRLWSRSGSGEFLLPLACFINRTGWLELHNKAKQRSSSSPLLTLVNFSHILSFHMFPAKLLKASGRTQWC